MHGFWSYGCLASYSKHVRANYKFLLSSINCCLKVSFLIISMTLFQNSVNARYQTIPYPWLVFGEKVKVNTVFIRDSTGVSDSILILFGGNLGNGATAGHLKMLDGYLEFFMDPSLAECYMNLKEQLDELVQKKVLLRIKKCFSFPKYLIMMFYFAMRSHSS
ncbi:DExH-box ATP-dependent RNA helicase DExH5, mitochondrial-like [Ipomoea triloba]|uniref:DExH-box ATP-dependent RNA helicase DExH5, mitochondrial-like n=1 Tax=Ipomoea triloba TaxID=35885 RepID=UPI00125DA582|nr:DExH-box ATP-dependent RNA helicase DExH5, mitochondrial-like [Ipomoea triloba]